MSENVIRKDRQASFVKAAYSTRSSQRLIKSCREREPTAKKTAYTLRNKAKEHVFVRICVYLCVCVFTSKTEKVPSANHRGEQ